MEYETSRRRRRGHRPRPARSSLAAGRRTRTTNSSWADDVSLYFDHDDNPGTAALLVTLPSAVTSNNTLLSDLIGQIQDVLDPVLSGDINVKADDDRVVFYSDEPVYADRRFVERRPFGPCRRRQYCQRGYRRCRIHSAGRLYNQRRCARSYVRRQEGGRKRLGRSDLHGSGKHVA